MTAKGVKNFLYGGLGFPIIFREVPLHEVMGELVPNVNHRRLQDIVFRALMTARFKYSGAHLAFIRHYMGLKQEELAVRVGLKGHSMISKWEKKGPKSTGMSGTMEAGVRVLMHACVNDSQILVKEIAEVLAGNLAEPKGPILVAA